MQLTRKTKNFILRENLLRPGDKVIIAVSGGPDSTTLLSVLHKLRHELGIQISVAHVNHRLRKTSDRDELFVKNMAEQMGLSFASTSLKLSHREKGSLEERARQMRLDFFLKLAKKQKANIIALGHTKSDLAETVLMRILRGTGLQGLQSILPKRTFGRCSIIRPLLDLKREEVEDYLKKNKIASRVDSTNRQKKYFRNKVRLELLPLLEKKYNQNVKEVLASLAQSSVLDYEYLQNQGNKNLNKLGRLSKSRKQIGFRLSQFRRMHPGMQRMVIRLAIEQLKGSTNRLTATHSREIDDLLQNRPRGAMVDLPGIQVRKETDSIVLAKKDLHK